VRREIIATEGELEKVVECIEESGKGIILLRGDLGSGKTTLVKAFAAHRGQEGVTSPTFSIQQIYGGEIYHYDLYSGGMEKFLELGLFEELQKEGYHFIEWGDSDLEEFLQGVGMEYLIVEIEMREQGRVYRCID